MTSMRKREPVSELIVPVKSALRLKDVLTNAHAQDVPEIVVPDVEALATLYSLERKTTVPVPGRMFRGPSHVSGVPVGPDVVPFVYSILNSVMVYDSAMIGLFKDAPSKTKAWQAACSEHEEIREHVVLLASLIAEYLIYHVEYVSSPKGASTVSLKDLDEAAFDIEEELSRFASVAEARKASLESLTKATFVDSGQTSDRLAAKRKNLQEHGKDSRQGAPRQIGGS